MDWYYSQNNQQQGPVSREKLEELVRSGEVKPYDLVWNEGMKEWAPLGSLPEFTAAEPPAAPAFSPPPATPTSAAPPVAGPMPPVSQGAFTQSAPPPAGTNGLAITSLVLGIFSPICCGCITGVPAVICGHIALSQISQNQNLGGKGLAIAGLVLGYLSLALTVVFYATGGPAQYQEIIEELMKQLEASQAGQGAPA